MSGQIVKILSEVELKVLQEIYQKQIPYASHVLSSLLIYFKWKQSNPDRHYLTFYALGDDWRKTGTFLMKYRTFDIFAFTLDKTGQDLYFLLHESNALKVESQLWPTVIYGIRDEHLAPVYRSIKELDIDIKVTKPNKFFWLPKEEALKFSINCPDDVYIEKLSTSHVDLICSLWPHTCAGSEEYLSTYIEMNHAYGIFLKENDQLVTWVIQNLWGTLIVLETVPEHKKKGYGSLITKKMCKEIAKDGINPLCSIVYDNIASEKLFTRLGFKYIGNCTFLFY